ncbi:MAG TPA: 1-deoxy-D-xylulose-5-phosphate synthase [Candidatus Enterenecus faecium]|uniref:1-deoxy-D-xylulose-5-phosphate synthase n=1 Tax=Candidatus Enterenecus faecium TaxID=2840780 RepID=A0A9D0YTX6_9FIRM|nr:1-deoxy-D-xylulose-5-phosphate synthase [Candidatus Enterenecus faecium]
MTDQQARQLCQQLRVQMIQTVSKTGGHLASSLGVVETLVAVHRVFDLDVDRLVFDVGHQCYAHKLLTGRGSAMNTLRKFGGLSGFPKPHESRADAFIAGHASNSVSVALGMARARTVNKEDYSVLALIGDGALTGGLAFEGLADAGSSGEPLIVILNDNGMSITKSVGGVAAHLSRQRLKPQYLHLKKLYRSVTGKNAVGQAVYKVTHRAKKMVKDAILGYSMFEDMGFTYLGPVDGHDVSYLTRMLRYAKELNYPVLLHVKTVKGKGYTPAERQPDQFHGVGPFDVEKGLAVSKAGGANFSSVFGETMCQLAEEKPELVAITAAMRLGTGLDEFARRYPQRFFDVGIAEGHAVAMTGGLAKQGALPVFAVYSTFLQRGYDMLIHDMALQNLHGILAVDRAGLVGEDGETHHGVFDVGFLSTVPGMQILCPASFAELRAMLRHAVCEMTGPVAIRYPRGGEGQWTQMAGVDGTTVIQEGTDVTLVAYGTMVDQVLQAAQLLEQRGHSVAVVKLNSIRPLDMGPIRRLCEKTGRLIVAEECNDSGCVGRTIISELALAGVPVKAALVNLGDQFVPQGSVSQLREMTGIDGAGICQKAMEVIANG